MEEIQKLMDLYKSDDTTPEQKDAIKYYLDGVTSTREWIGHLLKLIKWNMI